MKQSNKDRIDSINIGGNYETILPFYASIYSKLDSKGQLKLQKILGDLGNKLDKIGGRNA